MATQLEHTDTFGGEANYCWVKRAFTERDMTPRQEIRFAKAWAGLTGIRCRVENYGDMTAIYPRGICQVVFIDFIESEYARGERL